MSYFVVCTFDLKNASRTDYENAYAHLARLGLHRTVVAEGGAQVVAPTTMAMGQVTGQSAVLVRDDIANRVRTAFAARGLRSEILVIAANDWAWAVRTT